eukprot:Hpha_TRINITY_DN22632_c0_g1::TRINITY_DN22632_c0_g1_i1::g.192768::m.192768
MMMRLGFVVVCATAAVSVKPKAAKPAAVGGEVSVRMQEQYTNYCGTAKAMRARTAKAPERALLKEYERLVETVSSGWDVSVVEAGHNLDERCSHFSSENLRHKRLVFTHVPKTGGQSLQTALALEANRSGVDKKNLYMGHMRTGDVWAWYKQTRDTRGTDYVTMLRDPVDTLVSDYHFMRRTTTHNNNANINSYGRFDDWLLSAHDDGGPNGLALFAPWNRTSKTINKIRSFCSRMRWRPQEWRCLCTDLWRVYLDHTAELLTQRYAVVGVLDRLEDSLEVLRCRVPWLQGLKSLPHKNMRTDRKPKEVRNEEALRRKTYLQRGVYNFASRLLDADLACCRRQQQEGKGGKPGKKPGSSKSLPRKKLRKSES